MSAAFSPEERLLIRGEEVELEQLSNLRGWYPMLIRQQSLWWRFIGDKRFSEPFFFDSVRSLRDAKPRCLQSPFSALDKVADPLQPTAFIFHVSRCGSTLLTQLLAIMPECISISEPAILDSFLRHYYQEGDDAGAVKRLRGIVAALGQRRFEEEQQLIIKLDSWHIHSLPLFRRAFPDTPFLFLYRNPVEVMASHRRQRGRQMVPGMVTDAMPPLDFRQAYPGDLDGYAVQMLGGFFAAACRYADELTLVNYSQLPHIVWQELCAFLAIAPAPQQLKMMQARAGSHSKSGMAYAGDSEAMDGPCYATILPYYEQLEALRDKQVLLSAAHG